MSDVWAFALLQWRRHPVWVAVFLGLVVRTVAALSGFGWFAADDYFYVVEPAWFWLEQPELAYVSDIRSPLFPRFFYGLLVVGDTLADDPRWVLRIAYLGLGLVSLGVIPGAYMLARRLGPDAAATAALLAATYALMPRLATRGLIEAGAMVPLVWSLVLIDASTRGGARRRLLFALAGGALFMVGVMVRFQVGVIALPVLGWLAWRALRRPANESAVVGWAPVAGFAIAGLLGLAMQSGVDLSIGRPPLSTWFSYLTFNIERSSQFGVSPWYNYLLLLLVLTVPPATLALARPLWLACRAQPLVSVSIGVFVVAHMLVPHKEDRFLFPILPLVLVLLAAGLVELRRGGPWQRRAFAFFWTINCVALPVACLSDAQRNMTEPLLAIAETGRSHDVAVVGAKRVPHYYLGRNQRVRTFRTLEEFLATDHRPDFMVVRPAPEPAAAGRIAAAGLGCGEPRVFTGDWVDRVLLVLNPKRNKRRRPIGLLDCR